MRRVPSGLALALSLAVATARAAAQSPNPVQAELQIARMAIADAFIASARDTVDGHIDRAITHARRAVSLAPDAAEPHYWLAAALGRRALRTSFRTALRAATESYREAQQALRLDSLHAGAHAVVGRFHEELSRYSRPTRMVLSAMSGEPDVRGVSREAAERRYRRAIALDTGAVLYRHDYGRFLVGSGRLAEAKEQERIARNLPDRTPADRWLRNDLSALIARTEPR